jgi:hypothetical protein
MPSRRHLLVGLLAVGVLLSTFPVYASLVPGIEERRSAKLLGARPLGEQIYGERIAESEDLLDTFGGEHVVDVDRRREQAASGNTAHLDCNEDLGGAVAVLERAIAEGTAGTEETATANTLDCLADGQDFLVLQRDNDSAYYRFSVDETGGTTSVETETVSRATVVETVRERELVRYEALSAGEQRTVDRLLDSKDPESGDGSFGGHRPPQDSPLLDRIPVLLRKGETAYVVEQYGWVDGPDVGRLLVVRGGQVGGAIVLLAAWWVYRVGRRRETA